ncbi:MAG: replicative DNA helicase [Candidatus Spechtbacteria bacterium SB0662_bin_43]|uniref:Replicative DNA helicase n=1 Tax=Candidatus Spechtbacteria bacterium SB0662_bin_43 TaxID=2604897 RepID=A0A845DAX4_9BACT|nr:replicative DNA helicase [Candidatus Spechtbacteria bacterium SB0662_bin_43]
MPPEQTQADQIVSSAIIPPHNKKAEIAVLGSSLIDRKAFLNIADLLTQDDFYDPRHQVMYSFMVALWEKNSPIDIVTLSNILKESNKIEDVGGYAYLTEITANTPSPAHIIHYARIVHKASVMRQLIDAAHAIQQLGYREDQDSDILLDEAEQRIFKIAERGTIKQFSQMDSQSLEDAFHRIEKLSKDSRALRGIPTNFLALDQMLSGLQESDLILLGGRPSLGKSSLALDIARTVAIQQKMPVGIFSLEMGKDQITDRMIAAQAHVDLWKIRTGRKLRDEDFGHIQEAMNALSDAPIFIDDNLTAGTMQMRAMARRLQADKGLALLIIDYLQLIQPRKDRNNPVAEISEISRALKALARELNIPVLALSQLSRAVESRGGKPRLSDLRDSGSLEQDADVVLFIHRDMSQTDDPMAGTGAEIMIAKHRNGPTGKVNLIFNKQYASFSDAETYRQEPPNTGNQPSQEPQTPYEPPYNETNNSQESPLPYDETGFDENPPSIDDIPY